MKLSEAMRQGWQDIEQCIGVFQRFNWESGEQRIDAACAIGAACAAVSPLPIDSHGDAKAVFPQLHDPIDPEEVEDGSSIYRLYGDTDGDVRLSDAIVYYNDDARLGKEKIISLVEGMGY
jgi:hypothetical protein